MARLEAGLIRAGFAAHTEVTVRIGSERPEEVRKALQEFCETDGTPDDGGNCVVLADLHFNGGAPTHAVAPAELVDVPAVVLKVLGDLQEALSRDAKNLDPSQVGWKLSAERNPSNACGIILHIMTSSARLATLKLAPFARQFSEALGVAVQLDYGQLVVEHDRWAAAKQSSLATGLSIGNRRMGATVTMPVKYKDEKKAREADNASPRRYPALTAAHPFAGNAEIDREVYQPHQNLNPDRLIGHVTDKEYKRDYYDVNFLDAAIFESKMPPSFEFAKEMRQLSGTYTEYIGDSDRTYICGAASGLIPVTVHNFKDATVTILSGNGNPLVYKDMIEFSNDKDERPASLAGDSGAALLVVRKGLYYVAGLVVGGGERQAKTRRPRSYAIPIDRILNRFNIQSI